MDTHTPIQSASFAVDLPNVPSEGRTLKAGVVLRVEEVEELALASVCGPVPFVRIVPIQNGSRGAILVPTKHVVLMKMKSDAVAAQPVTSQTEASRWWTGVSAGTPIQGVLFSVDMQGVLLGGQVLKANTQLRAKDVKALRFAPDLGGLVGVTPLESGREVLIRSTTFRRCRWPRRAASERLTDRNC